MGTAEDIFTVTLAVLIVIAIGALVIGMIVSNWPETWWPKQRKQREGNMGIAKRIKQVLRLRSDLDKLTERVSYDEAHGPWEVANGPNGAYGWRAPAIQNLKERVTDVEDRLKKSVALNDMLLEYLGLEVKQAEAIPSKAALVKKAKADGRGR